MAKKKYTEFCNFLIKFLFTMSVRSDLEKKYRKRMKTFTKV